MKREFKFRAWDTQEKEIIPFEEIILPEWWEDDSLEIMQYTELKDKNGKDIYEGDIVNLY